MENENNNQNNETSSENVYQAPTSDVEATAELKPDGAYTGPKATSVGSGVEWIGRGWQLAKGDLGNWALTMIVFFGISFVLGLIPIIGALASALITYVWGGGLMMGCQAAKEGRGFKLDYLFAGFKHQTVSLVLLSVIVMVISIGVMLVTVGGAYFSILAGDTSGFESEAGMQMVLGMLIGMAILLPVMMAVWFAPALIVLQNLSVIEAMKASFFGCLKNILPFIIYGIIMMIMIFIAAIPLFLGLLIVMPIAICSTYSAYREIYLTEE